MADRITRRNLNPDHHVASIKAVLFGSPRHSPDLRGYVGNATVLKTLLTLFPYGSSGNHDFKVDNGSVPELYPLSSIFLIHSSKRYRLGQPFSTGPVWNKAGSLCFDCLLQDDTESSGQCSKLQVARVCLLVARSQTQTGQAQPAMLVFYSHIAD